MLSKTLPILREESNGYNTISFFVKICIEKRPEENIPILRDYVNFYSSLFSYLHIINNNVIVI